MLQELRSSVSQRKVYEIIENAVVKQESLCITELNLIKKNVFKIIWDIFDKLAFYTFLIYREA